MKMKNKITSLKWKEFFCQQLCVAFAFAIDVVGSFYRGRIQLTDFGSSPSRSLRSKWPPKSQRKDRH